MSAAKASVASLPQQGAGAPIEPDFAVFARVYEEGVAQVAWTRLVADLETPVSAMLKLAQERPNSFLLRASSARPTSSSALAPGAGPAMVAGPVNRARSSKVRMVVMTGD